MTLRESCLNVGSRQREVKSERKGKNNRLKQTNKQPSKQRR